MLTGFDWLRRSRNGQELLATLISLAERPDLFADAGEIGPPLLPCIVLVHGAGYIPRQGGRAPAGSAERFWIAVGGSPVSHALRSLSGAVSIDYRRRCGVAPRRLPLISLAPISTTRTIFS